MEADEGEKKKVQMEKAFCAVVRSGKKMSLKGIMRKYAMSKGDAYKIYVKVQGYLQPLPATIYRNWQIPAKRVVCLEWLTEHLVSFPFPHITDLFAENWRTDVAERERALKRDRAYRVWATSRESLTGKDPMNTLLCVFYAITDVVSMIKLVREMYANGSSIAHILVLLYGKVFLVLFTDVDPNARFPLDRIMRHGVHTSAYLWLNLKESCWESHIKAPTTLAVVPTKAVKAKPFVKVSDVTLSGMHILAVLWSKVWKRAAGAGENGRVRHVHVQPSKSLGTMGGGSVDATAIPWVLEIEAFARQFGWGAAPAAVPVALAAPPLETTPSPSGQ
jgi:hypothetical protein